MWDDLDKTEGMEPEMTEVEKIQADIERDFARAETTASEAMPPPPQPLITPAPAAAVYNTPPPPAHGARRASGPWLRRLAVVCIVCTLGTASFGFAFGAAAAWIAERAREEARSPAQPADSSPAADLGTTQYFFEPVPETAVATLADMIDLVLPSVVALTTITNPEDVMDMNRPPAARRNGTGVVFAEVGNDVFIVTSHYVVQRGSQVFVQFSCGAIVEARPLASDQDINISIITVSRNALREAGVEQIVLATFGDSSLMRMGDTVIAMGNARGEGISVTRGVISTEEQMIQMRAIAGTRRYLEVYALQTDASINYGDSGGPLLNARGEVVGIIDASINLFGANAQAEGIGQGIAATTVTPTLYQLVNQQRPAIGIEGISVSDRIGLAEDLGIPDVGVYVSRVMQDGAAARAGIRAGDIITVFDGEPVLDMDQLRGDIAARRPGDVIEVRVLREGETVVLEMTLLPVVFDRF